MGERRKFVRLDLNTKVEWEKVNRDEPASEFKSKNISGGGICLITDEIINIGDTLNLKIDLPTLKTIHAKGKVVWIEGFEIVGGRREKKYEAGIEFLDINDKDRQEIEKFVFSHLTK
ncbi:MAG: PilZ domain-containing protein [Candidatus Omnitrophota bacterium]